MSLRLSNAGSAHAVAFKINASSKLADLIKVTPNRGVLWPEDADEIVVQTTQRVEELRGDAAPAGEALQVLCLTLTAPQASILRSTASSRREQRPHLDAMLKDEANIARATSCLVGCSFDGGG